MEHLVEKIAALMWMALAVYRFCSLRKWNRRFRELHDELMKEAR